MTTNGRIEHIKRIGKQMQRKCPVELGLAHARTALARALGFENWYQLTMCLSEESSGAFRTRALAISPNPTDPTFLAAVKRFADSSGIDFAIANALCVEILPRWLERWHTWEDRRPDIKESPEHDAEDWDRPPEQRYDREEHAENRPLLAASAGDAGVRLITQGQHVPVVVRKKRRTFRPAN